MSYSDVLKSYSGVFLQNFFYKCDHPIPGSGSPIVAFFKPYSDVLESYSGVFMQFIEIESLKLDFHVDFFPHQTHPLTNQDLKTQVLSWNSSFRHSRCYFQHCFET